MIYYSFSKVPRRRIICQSSIVLYGSSCLHLKLRIPQYVHNTLSTYLYLMKRCAFPLQSDLLSHKRVTMCVTWSASAGRRKKEEAYAKFKRGRGKARGTMRTNGELTWPLFVVLAENSPSAPHLSAGDTEILWCGGKSLGVFRREIKFQEARWNDSPRALYGATGIVLTCLSQILTQVGLARRPGNETLAEQDETERPT